MSRLTSSCNSNSGSQVKCGSGNGQYQCTVEECKTKCTEHSFCTGFVRKDASNHCWLRKGIVIDECAEDNDYDMHIWRIQNQMADGTEAFTCECAAGYEGSTCADDIDECEPERASLWGGLTHPCSEHGTCSQNVPGPGYTCECETDYVGERCDG